MLPAMSTPRPATAEDLGALLAGRAWVDRSDLRTWEAVGTDAVGWLDDLVTVRVSTLGRGEARDALLLSPTGHVRASFRIVRIADDEVLLIQPDDQPTSLDALLAPYVLSADVRISAADLGVVSVPHGSDPPDGAVVPSIEASGWDLIASVEGGGIAAALHLLASRGLREVSLAALEDLRVREGRPRFPIDLDARSLPAEAGWDARIDADKGCFLGQESVARVRNLGHPPRLVIAVASDGAVAPGEAVIVEAHDGRGGAAEGETGVVTSVTSDGRRAIVRIPWTARGADLRAASGALLRRPPAVIAP